MECGSAVLALTGDEEEDAGSEGLVKAVKGRIVDEGHDANDDADEARQQGQDHESPRGIPVCCRTKGCKQAQSKRCNLSLSPRASFTGKQTSTPKNVIRGWPISKRNQ